MPSVAEISTGLVRFLTGHFRETHTVTRLTRPRLGLAEPICTDPSYVEGRFFVSARGDGVSVLRGMLPMVSSEESANWWPPSDSSARRDVISNRTSRAFRAWPATPNDNSRARRTPGP